MLTRIAEIQPLFLGLVLAWAGGYKTTGHAVGAAAARSALAELVGQRRARLAYRGIGGAELAVAALLLTPPAAPWKAWLAFLLASGFLVYLGYARIAAPESSCGCMSDDTGPVTWRNLARAGMLMTAAVAATWAQTYWMSAFRVHPVPVTMVLAAECGLLLALSPDLDHHRRRLAGRLRALLMPHPLVATGGAEASLAAALSQLHRSKIYCAGGALLCSDVLDFWEAGDWRLVSYAGRLAGESAGVPVTVVFAVPKRYAPDDVRMSIVDTNGVPAPQPGVAAEPVPTPASTA